MADSPFVLRGHREVAAKLLYAATHLPLLAAGALYEESAIEKGESQRRTPVLTGVARASHELEGPTFRGRNIECRITAGGAAEGYIIPLHEKLDVFHKNGQAKFLESTLHESRPYFAGRISDRIDMRRLIR